MMGNLQAYLPTAYRVFDSFWPKMAWPPIYQISPQATFLFPWMKKVPKGERFAQVEEVKQNGRSSQNLRVQKLLSSGEMSR